MPDAVGKPRVLIVDDTPQNIHLLMEMLKGEYAISAATSGEKALKLASVHLRPDIILLDIVMPDMDGYEICAKLKAGEATRNIPVIFITALSAEENEAKGLELGATDYITKPFSPAIVKARLRNHLELKKYQNRLEELVKERTEEIEQARQELERYNQTLTERIEERTQELTKAQNLLAQAEKMAALGQLVAGVAHEINTPAGAALTAVSYLAEKRNEISVKYENRQMTKSDLEKFLAICRESVEIIQFNIMRAGDLIKSFKQVAVDQSSEQSRVFNMKEYLEQILLSLTPKLKQYRHKIDLQSADDIEIHSYPGAFSQVMTNFLMNSLVHAYDEQDQGNIRIAVDRKDGNIVIEYADDGKGIDENHLNRIYEPFFTTKRGSGGTGLGLNIVYNIVTQKLGGSIQCLSEMGKGTVFVIEIPEGRR